jgi:hypothetical protein
MARNAKSKRKRAPKTVLKLPDLKQSKSAVLNRLTSLSSQRSYDQAIREFIEWHCSEPRLDCGLLLKRYQNRSHCCEECLRAVHGCFPFRRQAAFRPLSLARGSF